MRRGFFSSLVLTEIIYIDPFVAHSIHYVCAIGEFFHAQFFLKKIFLWEITLATLFPPLRYIYFYRSIPLNVQLYIHFFFCKINLIPIVYLQIK